MEGIGSSTRSGFLALKGIAAVISKVISVARSGGRPRLQIEHIGRCTTCVTAVTEYWPRNAQNRVGMSSVWMVGLTGQS